MYATTLGHWWEFDIKCPMARQPALVYSNQIPTGHRGVLLDQGVIKMLSNLQL